MLNSSLQIWKISNNIPKRVDHYPLALILNYNTLIMLIHSIIKFIEEIFQASLNADKVCKKFSQIGKKLFRELMICSKNVVKLHPINYVAAFLCLSIYYYNYRQMPIGAIS